MDLSPPAFYLYLLMVVTLYTSPIIVIALIVGWRKNQLGRTVKGILMTLPVLALVAQVSFHLDLKVLSLRLESDREFYDKTFPEEVAVFDGRIVAHKDQGGYTYTYYQFEVDAFTPRSLEILMPPPDITSIAMIKLTGRKEAIAGTESAQLVIRNTGSYYNPIDQTPQEYFRQYYPDVAGEITTDQVMILTLQPGDNSRVTQFYGKGSDSPWRSQMASVDF